MKNFAVTEDPDPKESLQSFTINIYLKIKMNINHIFVQKE